MKSGFSARNEVSTPLAENRRPLLNSPAVPNRPATGTPTPWASRLSVLSRDRRRYSRSYRPESFYQETHPILKSSDLQHWFKNWQHLRNDKITASTFALAIGFWPRGRAKLWLEKLGTIEPFSGNIATCWSNIKERDALKSYMLMTKIQYHLLNSRCTGRITLKMIGWLLPLMDLSTDTFMACTAMVFLKSNAHTLAAIRAERSHGNECHCIMIEIGWRCMSGLFTAVVCLGYIAMWNTLKIALSVFWWKHVQPAKAERFPIHSSS